MCAGRLLTPATKPIDPRSWFALFRYSLDFPPNTQKLTPYAGMSAWPSGMKRMFAEEMSIGVAADVASRTCGPIFMVEAEHAVRLNLLQRRPGTSRITDYVLMDQNGYLRLLEVKGAVKARRMMRAPREKGRGQILAPSLPRAAHPTVIGYVAATNFALDGAAPTVGTVTYLDEYRRPLTRDDGGSPKSEPKPLSQDEQRRLVSSSYLKFVRFAALRGVQGSATSFAGGPEATAEPPYRRLSETLRAIDPLGFGRGDCVFFPTNVFGADCIMHAAVHGMLIEGRWEPNDLIGLLTSLIERGRIGGTGPQPDGLPPLLSDGTGFSIPLQKETQ